ncbi:HAD-IIB family hydrolase [Konateibacter massiliensis]|uniref:HAD-IIB family hydrolase n=1 Tax=Konateibacter massiliensis TaxID=2002841 RepID=UPI000C146630|nr:HAD-IIB family hydrolase [Konateibacter massiliensis]
MVKAIFFDLDGTLLNREKTISGKTRLTLEKCKEKGVKLFIATARPPLLDKMLSWDENMLSLFDGGSYYNGGCIKIGNQKEYQPITDEIVENVVKLVCEYEKLNIALQLEDEKHAFRYPLDDNGYKSWGVTLEESLALGDIHNLKTVKILIFFANLIDSVTPIDDTLIASLKSLCQNKAQLYLTDGGKAVQIMGNSINKFESIEKIRSIIGLEKNEIAVFGDDVNDIEMLSAYQYSFAMGNAEAHVKEKARYVTLDNDSNGIHHAICDVLQVL